MTKQQGQTALMGAAAEDNDDILKMLLSHQDIDMNAQDLVSPS